MRVKGEGWARREDDVAGEAGRGKLGEEEEEKVKTMFLVCLT